MESGIAERTIIEAASWLVISPPEHTSPTKPRRDLSTPSYSYLKAMIGSTREARRAGIHAALRAITDSTTARAA